MNSNYTPTWEESSAVEEPNQKINEPTWEQSTPIEKKSTPEKYATQAIETGEDVVSDLKDIGISAAQGATFGFGDELLAGINALMAGDPSKFREFQQKYEKEYKELQERSPTLSMIGELAGGFAIPGGAVAKGLTKGATLGQKFMSAMKPMAAMGAASAIGGSEEYIDPTRLKESLGELALTGAKGAAIGAGTGAAFAGAGKVLGKLGQEAKEYVAESPALQRAMKAFELERGGINLTTETGQQKIISKEIETANETAKQLLQPFEFAKKKYNDAINAVKNLELDPRAAEVIMDREGVLFEPKKLYDRLLGEIEKIPSLQKIDKNFYEKFIRDGKYSNQPVSISDLLRLREKLLTRRDVLSKHIDPTDFDSIYGYGFNKQTGEMEVPGFVQDLDEVIFNILPDAQKLRSEIKSAARIPEQILNKNIDPSAQPIKLMDMDEAQGLNKLQKQIQYNIETAGGTSRTGIESRKELHDLKDTLKQVHNQIIAEHPEQKEILSDPDELIKKLMETSKESAALTSTIGIRQMGDVSPAQLQQAFTGVGLPQMGMSQILGKAGRITKFAEPKVEKVEKAATFPIRKAANILKASQNPAMQKLGDTLNDAVQNKAAASTAAALNSLFQSKSARRELNIEPGQEWIFTDED